MATAKKSAKSKTSQAKSAATARRAVRTQATIDNRKELIVTVPPVKVPKVFGGFIDFVRTQGVVGLAVGLVLGVAAKSVVDSLVANVFNPLIGMVGGGSGSLDGRFICLKHTAKAVNNELVISCTNKLGYGSVMSSIISFLIVAAVVYLVVKGLKLDKLDKPKAP